MLKNKMKILQKELKSICNPTLYLPVLIVCKDTDLNYYKQKIGPNTVIITRGEIRAKT